MREVPYYINPANGDVTASAAISAIQAAASAWSMQSNADFSFYYMGQTSGSSVSNNGRNEVFFRSTTSGNLAETYRYWNSAGTLVDSDIVFYDGSWRFFGGSSGCSSGYYIREIATHEFGHALGLNHSSVSTASMSAGATACATWKSSLDPDDIAGVEKLYPSSGANAAPSVTISSPANNTSVTFGTASTFSGSASDREDGSLTSKLVWKSNLDGTLGTGGTLSKALSAGTHTVRATVTDSAGASSYQQITIYVISATGQPAGLALSATGYKRKGLQHASLKWTGASSSKVDIYRDGVRVANTANDGAHTDNINQKGAGSYTYKLCEAGTTTCSSSALVRF